MKSFIRTFPALLLIGLLVGAAQPASGAGDSIPPEFRGKRETPRFVSICFETFSVELAEATTLYQGKPKDAALYKELTDRVSKGKAKQEGFAVARCRSGYRADLKSTSELIYPASYLPALNLDGTQTPPNPGAASEPPDSASPPVAGASDAPGPGSPLPTDFQTREVGFTLEIEPTLSSDLSFIDLRIMPAFVNLADRAKWGSGELATETPVFESQDLAMATTLTPNQPGLIGTLSRPPVSKVDADSAKRVWFAFVTAKIVSVTPEK